MDKQEKKTIPITVLSSRAIQMTEHLVLKTSPFDAVLCQEQTLPSLYGPDNNE